MISVLACGGGSAGAEGFAIVAIVGVVALTWLASLFFAVKFLLRAYEQQSMGHAFGAAAIAGAHALAAQALHLPMIYLLTAVGVLVLAVVAATRSVVYTA